MSETIIMIVVLGVSSSTMDVQSVDALNETPPTTTGHKHFIEVSDDDYEQE